MSFNGASFATIKSFSSAIVKHYLKDGDCGKIKYSIKTTIFYFLTY
jgi:hypothetical protein